MAWYTAPSAVACVAAYDAVGATSLADSYDVRPSLAISDLSCAVPGCKAVPPRNGGRRLSGFYRGADGTHVVIGDDCGMVFLASRRSPLPYHVCRILGTGAEPQMGGVAARRVIAVVANNKAVRDGAVSEFPGEFRREAAMAANGHSAVTLGGSGASERPTGIWSTGFVNLWPETMRSIVKRECRIAVFYHPFVMHVAQSKCGRGSVAIINRASGVWPRHKISPLSNYTTTQRAVQL